MSLKIPRREYAEFFGPTVGDRIRLADTELFIGIERDFAHPGDEVRFGGGKVIRDGMGQSADATAAGGALDLVITNAVILDHWGMVKADIGVRDGRIVGIGKAGNPDVMEGVTPGMIIGAATEADRRRETVSSPRPESMRMCISSARNLPSKRCRPASPP